MALVPAAGAAPVLDALGDAAGFPTGLYGARKRGGERGPPGRREALLARFEQGRQAGGAQIGAGPLLTEERAAPGDLRGRFEENMVRGFRENGPPRGMFFRRACVSFWFCLPIPFSVWRGGHGFALVLRYRYQTDGSSVQLREDLSAVAMQTYLEVTQDAGRRFLMRGLQGEVAMLDSRLLPLVSR